MTFDLAFELPSFERDIFTTFGAEMKVRVQDSMAHRFAGIIHQNFGSSGEDRPHEWQTLSENYALDYHDGDRTPTLQLTGELQSSIEIEEGNPEGSSVFTNNEYAAAHQWGIKGKLHARPFFPMNEDGELTEYAKSEVVQAALGEYERALNEK